MLTFVVECYRLTGRGHKYPGRCFALSVIDETDGKMYLQEIRECYAHTRRKEWKRFILDLVKETFKFGVYVYWAERNPVTGTMIDWKKKNLDEKSYCIKFTNTHHRRMP